MHIETLKTFLSPDVYEPFAQQPIARLEELRLVALERRVDADLALGRHADVAGELPALVREHPLREHLRAQLMLALYRCGRQADALEVYRSGRTHLTEELGLEPGAELPVLRRDSGRATWGSRLLLVLLAVEVLAFLVSTIPGVRDVLGVEPGFDPLLDGWLQGAGYVTACVPASRDNVRSSPLPGPPALSPRSAGRGLRTTPD